MAHICYGFVSICSQWFTYIQSVCFNDFIIIFSRKFRNHMQKNLLETIENAGTAGIDTGELYGDVRFSEAAVGVTNELARLRESGAVTTRREFRDGQRVVVYYSAANAPAGSPREVVTDASG